MSSQKTNPQLEVPNSPRKVIKFQCGLFREEIPFIGEDALCLTPEILQEYMCDFLDLRVCLFSVIHLSLHHHDQIIMSLVQFPEHPYGDLSPKILLYKHSQDDSLVVLKENDQIEDGMIIELILTGKHLECVIVMV